MDNSVCGLSVLEVALTLLARNLVSHEKSVSYAKECIDRYNKGEYIPSAAKSSIESLKGK